jgi:hypothetical protein
MKVLFLDIDGVLNSVSFSKKTIRRSLICDPDSLDPEACLRLQNFIKSHEDLVIVISSTWRKFYSLEELKNLLQEKGIDSSKIIEYTPVLHGQIRGTEIRQWLDSQFLKSNFPVSHIAILDDDSDMGDLKDYLVQTNVEFGLQDCNLLELEEILKKPL